MIPQFINNVFIFSQRIDAGREKWKDEILEQWRLSFKMPRKKKKRVRKELRLDWSIACYDPFDFA